MSRLRTAICLLVLLACGIATAADWSNTAEQKIWGLMTVWAEAKYTFPHFDNRPDLDWDATVREYLPRAMATEDLDAYYAVLMEMVALLKDGHTRILPPWGYFKPGHDMAPLEVRIMDGRFYVDRLGEDPALAAAGLTPGAEILAVDGVPVDRYFAENVLRYHMNNTAQGTEALFVVYLLAGPAGQPVELTIRGRDGEERTAAVVRNAMSGDHPFMPRLVMNAMVATTIETQELPGGLVYVNVPNFDHAQIAEDFAAVVDGLGEETRGLIIDVRYNPGGSDTLVRSMVSRLIDEPVSTPIMKYRHFVGADAAWGNPPEWETSSNRIDPHDGKRYLGPLVVLMGGLTASSSEDLAIELRTAGRATLVGQTTGGSAGNGLRSELPGGGTLFVATFTALLPGSEEEYVGVGVAPDMVVWPTPADLAASRDVVLERAIELLAE
ncbi:MAG: hypothetical protein GY838_14230 [bacterium]|nr:hypothetical protein [bacterium]